MRFKQSKWEGRRKEGRGNEELGREVEGWERGKAAPDSFCGDVSLICSCLTLSTELNIGDLNIIYDCQACTLIVY